MIRRIEAERLGRTARAQPRLHHAIRRPRLGAARLQDQRHLEHGGRRPQRMHARRVVGQDDAHRRAAREITERASRRLTDAFVEHRQIESARQAAEHFVDLRQHAVHLQHVAPHHHVRHAGGRRQLLDVGFRALHAAVFGRAIGIERQIVVEEMSGRALAHRDQLRHRQLRQRRARLFLAHHVAADQADVRLADADQRLARAVMQHRHGVEALVGLPEPQDRKVQQILRRGLRGVRGVAAFAISTPLRPPSSRASRTGGRCARRPTDTGRTALHARTDRAPGSAA